MGTEATERILPSLTSGWAKNRAIQYIAPKASPLVRDVHSGPVPLPPVVPKIANRPWIIASKLGIDESKPAAMTGRGFEASGNTDSSGMGPERALEAIIPAPRAQRESIPLPELPCGRRSDIKPKVRQRV